MHGNEQGDTDHFNGLFIWPTSTMNVSGVLAAIYITVTGLSERELPK